MKPCPSCDKDIASNAKTCPHCGWERTGAEPATVCMGFGFLTIVLIGALMTHLDELVTWSGLIGVVAVIWSASVTRSYWKKWQEDD